MGDQCDGAAHRSRTAAGLPGGGPDPPEGESAPGRGVPRPADPSAPSRTRPAWSTSTIAISTTSELQRLVQQADIVLLPYDSREQVTSGVLIEAVTAGKPVISTGFPHAVELLSSGAGLIVDRQDPTSIADAVRRVLTEPGSRPACGPRRIGSLRNCCGRRSPTATARWRSRQPVRPRAGQRVSRRHDDGSLDPAAGLVRPPLPAQRPRRAVRARPVHRTAPRARLLHRRHRPRARRPGPGARAERAAHDAGRLLPVVGDRRPGRRRPLPQPAGPRPELDRRAVAGRLLGSCALGSRHGGRPAAARLEAAALALAHFDLSAVRRSDISARWLSPPWAPPRSSPGTPTMPAPEACSADAAALIAGRRPRTDAWPWPEPRLRYANAALPEVLLAAGSLLGDSAALDSGSAMLSWLLDVETAGDHLSITRSVAGSPENPGPGSTSSRSRSRPWPMPVPARTRSPAIRAGGPDCFSARPGSSARTTPASAWSTPSPVAAATACTAPAATRTRGRIDPGHDLDLPAVPPARRPR